MNLHNMKLESVYAKGEDGEFHLIARLDECETTATAEKEYIKRAYVLKCMEDSYKNAGISAEAKAKMTRWLNKAPAADVRPVVLCKDCKYYNDETCDRWSDGTYLNPNDFCSRAAKREEN